MRDFFDFAMTTVVAVVLALAVFASLTPKSHPTATSSVLYRDGKIVP